MRIRSRLLILAASFAVGVIFLELALRHVLFSAGEPPSFAA
jgi:hypothetical protein